MRTQSSKGEIYSQNTWFNSAVGKTLLRTMYLPHQCPAVMCDHSLVEALWTDSFEQKVEGRRQKSKTAIEVL